MSNEKVTLDFTETMTITIKAPAGYGFVSDKVSEDDITIHYFKDNDGMVANGLFSLALLEYDVAHSRQSLIEQAEKDKSSFSQTWFYGWEFKNYTGEKWLRYGTKNIGWLDSREIRRHPHANLIMQCEQDKIDYPEFWCDLYQFRKKKFIDKWLSFDTGDYFKNDGCEYRQHPHRKSIIAFHACSYADKKRWECCSSEKMDGWTPCLPSPDWTGKYYRLRPRTCKVTLQNGTVLEYPEPVRDTLEIGQEYWIVFSWSVESYKWKNESDEYEYLSAGTMHLTKEAAEQHCSVLQAVNSQVAL
jgi:hypothetical protein